MAFGFGFNKQKVLSAAEKCVQQGKLQNAISEYIKVLKADPKDLTVLNTVGDLYSRLGEMDKAAEYFKNVGDAYAAQGFTVKAIAMYKKLSKLKSSMECVLRLAELYTQQGLFNDARAQYLQVAEEFLKTGQLDQAVRIFQKTLEMDPDNVAMRTKLAEVYVRLGKKDDAWKLLTAAAESLRVKGQLAAADEILQKMLKLEPGSSYALVLRGRAALDAGDFGAAIECLGKVADLDSNPEGLKALFQAYLRSKKFKEARALAIKLASVHDDIAPVVEYTDALMEAQMFGDALEVYAEHADKLLRNHSEKLMGSLRSIIGHVQEDPEALQTVLGLFLKAGENTHLTEIYELLAHAYTQSGELEKAREYYLKLTQLEPGNQMHTRNYQQVLERQGTTTAPHMITAEEGAVLADELEATAPFIDQRYDDEVALAVRAALTDAELFISYNMPAKALDPLIGALPKAPRDLRLNQKLAALHTRAERFAEAAVCCRTLESIYHDAGHAEEASRYGNLANQYEERSGSRTAATAPIVASTPAVAHSQEFEISAPAREVPAEAVAAPEVKSAAKSAAASGLYFHAAPPVPSAVPPAPVAAPEFSIAPAHDASSEIDLSSEWEQDLTVEAPPTAEQPEFVAAVPEAVADFVAPMHAQFVETPAEEAVEAPAHIAEIPVASADVNDFVSGAAAEQVSATAPNVDEEIEEVRFYLGQGMTDQAAQVLARAEAKAPGSPELAVLRLGIEAAKQHADPQPLQPEFGIPQAEAVAFESEPDLNEVEAPEVAEVAVPEIAPASIANAQPWPSERPVLQDLVADLEQSLPDQFLAEPEAARAQLAEAHGAHAASSEVFQAGTLDAFVNDLEASLGNDFAPAPMAPPAPPPQVRPAVAAFEMPAVRAAAASAGAFPVSASAGPAPTNIAPPVAAPAPLSNLDSNAVDLSDMFGELKHELEEGGSSTEEDPETHYNLGIAFREMGLLDEAIGELQKVCQSVDRGHPFPQIMQAYTWLAQCFLDKGMPEVAVRWYEKALKIPTIDQETRTALHYELASSLESSGNNPAALSNFLEVYSSNIDYRDVGERIKALRT